MLVVRTDGESRPYIRIDPRDKFYDVMESAQNSGAHHNDDADVLHVAFDDGDPELLSWREVRNRMSSK